MAAPTPSTTTGIPERIGRYRIVRPLSKGGMAMVFEARRESLAGVAPRVAIKVILPNYASSNTFKELFINEARLGAAMQHQNLVQIQDFDSDGERYFLVMEYVDGLTLSRMIGLAARHGIRIPMGVICEIGRQACDGLHYAHQATDPEGRALGLVHRDIKPSNLIVTPQGSVKILDFGISKGTLRSERSGSVKGTWGYMSPEQATGDRVGPTADIFGLGIVLYEMAARRSMFKGRSEEEIRDMLLDDHAARMVAALDSSYAPIAGVLEKALQRDRDRRFATAADFGRALAELLPDPISARDQTMRFFEQTRALNEAERSKHAASTVGSGTSAVPRSVGSMSGGVTSAETSPALIAFSVLAGAFAVVSAFILGYTLTFPPVGPALPTERPMPVATVDQLSEPPPAAAPATLAPPAMDDRRPPPASSVAPVDGQAAPAVQAVEEDPPARVVVRPSARVDEAEPPATPAPEAVADAPPAPTHAVLRLSSIQPAEIFVDGKLVRTPPGQPVEVEPGEHVVSFLAPDGRQVSRKLHLEAGDERKLVWDFEQWDYR